MTSCAGVVDYTLWRNGQQLGRVRIAFPVANSKSGIGGMLEVDDTFSDIDDLIQGTWPVPGGPKFQSLTRDAPARVALRELADEESQGVPPERLLILRDATGSVVPLKFLMIQRMPGPVADRGELFDVCRARGISPSPWMLVAH